MITNKCPFPQTVLEQLPSLRFISLLATGTNNIDLEAARKAGVTVANVPAYSTESVAQHTIAMLLALTNRVEAHDRDVQAGGWSRSPFFSYELAPLVDLRAKSLAVIGFGSIGRQVAEIARGLGMKILAVSRSRKDAPDWPDFTWATMEEAFCHADVVSLHCPLTPETEHLVNERTLAQMKPSAFLLNTARGPLIDEAALAEALRQEQLAGAAVDVASKEPIATDNPLLGVPKLLITPHIAWRGPHALRTLLDETFANVQAFLDGIPRNVVT